MIGASWSKSSFCGPQPNCVEVRLLDGKVQVRNDLSGPMLVFDRGEWDTFLLGAINGEFDLPDE